MEVYHRRAAQRRERVRREDVVRVAQLAPLAALGVAVAEHPDARQRRRHGETALRGTLGLLDRAGEVGAMNAHEPTVRASIAQG